MSGSRTPGSTPADSAQIEQPGRRARGRDGLADEAADERRVAGVRHRAPHQVHLDEVARAGRDDGVDADPGAVRAEGRAVADELVRQGGPQDLLPGARAQRQVEDAEGDGGRAGSPSGPRRAARRRPRRRRRRSGRSHAPATGPAGTPPRPRAGSAGAPRAPGPPARRGRAARRAGDPQALGRDEPLEVAQRAEVDVGRREPGVRQRPGDRHGPAQPPGEARSRQWPKLGNETIPTRPTRIISRSTRRRAVGRLERLGEHDHVEPVVLELGQARVDVGLHHRDAARDAGVEGLGVDLDALAAAAAGARSARPAGRRRRSRGRAPATRPGPSPRRPGGRASRGRPRGRRRSRNAATVRWYSGISSRNESCPWGEAISRKVTWAPAAESTRTISREWAVSKRQSLSNETTRKRVSPAARAWEVAAGSANASK